MKIIEKLKEFFIEEIEVKNTFTNDVVLHTIQKHEIDEIPRINERSKIETYSYSRINTFEQCPFKYKLQYIDKEDSEIDDTIESFMGRIVHKCLKELYKRKNFEQGYSKEGLIKFYRELWNKEYSEDIRIVKKYQGLNADNYMNAGEKFLSDYYETYKPFKQLNILELETEDKITLPDGNQWHIRIDKLGYDDKGNYYVCDYKTSSRMMNQREADEDKQVAMYSIWVKNKFKKAKSIKLVWHMLAFNQTIVSERTEEELNKLQNEIVNIINKIESTKDFPTRVSGLCNYCGFTSKCPAFNNR